MNHVVLSGDIVSSTGLNSRDRKLIEKKLNVLFKELKSQFNTYSRIIKGDYLECVVPNPAEGLRVALIVKCLIKSIPVKLKDYKKDKSRVKQFIIHGIRIAIGYGGLSRYQPQKGIIDGDAIYFSGRAISGTSTHDKERIVIKNTLFFASNEEKLNANFTAILALIDVLMSKATARQCEVLYQKLMGLSEDEIAKNMDIGQSAVNQHSTSAGWNAIEEAVEYFEKVLTGKSV